MHSKQLSITGKNIDDKINISNGVNDADSKLNGVKSLPLNVHPKVMGAD